MEYLPTPAHDITRCTKVLHQRDRLRKFNAQLLTIPINPRVCWSNSCQQTYTAKIAQGGSTVRVPKGNTTLGKTINIRRLWLRMAIQMFDSITQVIHSDEQHIG